MLNKLKAPKGAITKKKRLGRGESSVLGKTSGKGHKGLKARSGGGSKRGYEGGQTPITRRLPKRGFTNEFKTEYSVLNVGNLTGFSSGETVDVNSFYEKRLVGSKRQPVKVLGDGDIKVPLIVKVAAFSKSAKAKIIAAGGKTEVSAVGE